jgi:hypothetical protein
MRFTGHSWELRLPTADLMPSASLKPSCGYAKLSIVFVSNANNANADRSRLYIGGRVVDFEFAVMQCLVLRESPHFRDEEIREGL